MSLNSVFSRAIAVKGLSEVAYVRFASVYRNFRSVSDFVSTLEGMNADKAELAALV